MTTDQTILLNGVIIISTGYVHTLVLKNASSSAQTKVLAGGIGFVALTALLSSLNADIGRLMAALSTVAVVAVLLSEGPSIFTAIKNAESTKG